MRNLGVITKSVVEIAGDDIFVIANLIKLNSEETTCNCGEAEYPCGTIVEYLEESGEIKIATDISKEERLKLSQFFSKLQEDQGKLNKRYVALGNSKVKKSEIDQVATLLNEITARVNQIETILKIGKEQAITHSVSSAVAK